jgi:hypothetical protein
MTAEIKSEPSRKYRAGQVEKLGSQDRNAEGLEYQREHNWPAWGPIGRSDAAFRIALTLRQTGGRTNIPEGIRDGGDGHKEHCCPCQCEDEENQGERAWL